MNKKVKVYYSQTSNCAQKVKLFLREKGVAHSEQRVLIHTGESYQPWYMRLHPKGQVPLLQHGDKYIPESEDIMDYIEKNFDGPKLIPESSTSAGAKVKKMRAMCCQVSYPVLSLGLIMSPDMRGDTELPGFIVNSIGTAIQSNTSYCIEEMTRFAEENPELRALYQAKIDDFSQKAQIGEADGGTEGLEQLNTQLALVSVIMNTGEEMLEENAKSGHADYWLSDPQFNMADIQIGVLMRRLKWLGYTQQSFRDGKHPHLEKYFQRLCERESYIKVCIDPITKTAMTLYFLGRVYEHYRPRIIAGTLIAAVGMAAYYYYYGK